MPLPNGKPLPSDGVTSLPALPVSPPKDVSGVTGIHPSYSLPPPILSRVHGTLEATGKRARRRMLGLAAQATYLAVMDPASGATTKDRLAAADGAARVAGLVREGADTKVSLVVTFKGLRRGAIDPDAIEARVVEATRAGPAAQDAGDGATVTPPGGGGE